MSGGVLNSRLRVGNGRLYSKINSLVLTHLLAATPVMRLMVPFPDQTPSQAGVLSRGKRGILRSNCLPYGTNHYRIHVTVFGKRQGVPDAAEYVFTRYEEAF